MSMLITTNDTMNTKQIPVLRFAGNVRISVVASVYTDNPNKFRLWGGDKEVDIDNVKSINFNRAVYDKRYENINNKEGK